MKKIISLLVSLLVVFTLSSCSNKTVIQKKLTTSKDISSKNEYVKINSYKLNNDSTITWNINFLQDTKNTGSVFIYVLLYDKDGNPVNYHKVEVDPVRNSSFDELQLIKDKQYPINESYNFRGGKNTYVNYAKIKYCIQTIYYKDSEGEWVAWENPNLNDWIKQNNKLINLASSK